MEKNIFINKSREEQEKEAKELGVKGVISNFSDETLEKKIAEKKEITLVKEEKGSLEGLVVSLSDKQAQLRKLQEEIAELEADNVQRGTKEQHITDFSSLTPAERISDKAYYKIIDKTNGTVYEYHGGQMDCIFGKDKAMRNAFLEGKLGITFDYNGRFITFLYLLKLVKA